MTPFKSKPCSIQMAITYRCNLRCIHCDIWKKSKTEELQFEQWAQILDRLKSWLGPFRLDISGGEPFLRDDIIEIIDYCDRNEIQSVVTTNGTLLKKDIIKRLSQIKSLTLNISLDGVNPETHDYLRGKRGTYDRVMEKLLEFKKNGRICHITLATILMGYNMEEIMSLIKKLIVDKLADAINFQALDHNFHVPYNPDWFKENKLWPSEDKKPDFLSLLDWIIRIKKAGVPIYNPVEQLVAMRDYFDNPQASVAKAQCISGFRNFIMNPDGDVLLCWNMPGIGNALRDNPEQIWSSSLAEKIRQEISGCSRTCRILNCNFNDTLLGKKI